MNTHVIIRARRKLDQQNKKDWPRARSRERAAVLGIETKMEGVYRKARSWREFRCGGAASGCIQVSSSCHIAQVLIGKQPIDRKQAKREAVEKRFGPRARPGPETSKSLWFGHDQEIVCGASAVWCICIFNLCWPAGRGMRCLPGWLCCGKGVVASAPLAPQAGPPFRLFARMSSFPAAHTAGDYRHCRLNFVVRGGEEHTEPRSVL